MAEIKQVKDRTIVDYMARDYDSLLKSMQDLIPFKLPEWDDYKSEADFGNVLLQLFAHMGDILSYYQDRIANESFLSTAQTRRSIIEHLKLIGYKLATASPASAMLEVVVDGTRTDQITIKKGNAFATKSMKDKKSVRFEYTNEEDLKIDFSTITSYTDAKGKSKKKYSSIPIEEGRYIKDEFVGTSDGTPNQTFTLAHSGLILRSLGLGQSINTDITILVKLGGTIEKWTLQESLAFSRNSQKDYVIEINDQDQATIRFGDSAFGAIPPKDAIIEASYRVGGGSDGNVAANSIATIVDAPPLTLISAEIYNKDAATGGADRETIKHAVEHAPSVFRSLKRAVTAEDFKALALNFKGVGKVRAEATNWSTVTLFVAPQSGGKVSDVLKANLLAYFEDKRPISTTIEIKDVDYIPIYISATIGIKTYYSEESVEEKVENAVKNLLAFDNVSFAQTIYLSKFYEAIEKVEGVEYVTIDEFRDPSEISGTVNQKGRIELEKNEIPIIPKDSGYTNGIKLTSEKGK